MVHRNSGGYVSPMPTRNLTGSWAALLVCMATLSPTATAADLPGNASENLTAKKTITRKFDHVVIKGSELTGNLKGKIPLMRLYAFIDGTMQPIPFQIDEITEQGDWVLTSKSPYLSTKKSKKIHLSVDDPPEVLDENDELVFMVSDTGDRAFPADWPQGCTTTDEITLKDPLTHEQAWVYLFAFHNAEPLSPLDYVDYHFPKTGNKDNIHSDIFTLGFSHEVPITWDTITFNDDVNIIDRMKIRIYARLFHLFNIRKNENHLNSTLWQYTDGPVRVIRMVRSSIDLVSRLKSPSVNSETLYYRNAVLIPFRVKMPFSPKGIASNLYFEGGADFRDLYGWKVKLNTEETWLSVDGKMDGMEQNLTADGARWFIMKGPDKAMILYLHMCNEEEYDLHRSFLYLDDDQTRNPPEFHPAQTPYVGYRVEGLEDLKGGSVFHFYVIAFLINQDYSERELLRAMNIFDNPIEVDAQGFTVKDTKKAPSAPRGEGAGSG